ncbi:MAG: hypothetical protein WC479_00395 [Candidatus Izemoplasmatales bacterium]|jgi:hypothetical protein
MLISLYITPVMYADPSGYFPLSLIFAPSLIEALGAILIAAAPYIAVLIIIVLVAIVIYKAYELTNTLIDVQASKKSRESGKEKSSEKPSYVNKGMLDKSLTAEENATNMMNNQWGKGNWGKGPKTDYYKIFKWITRGELLKQVINTFNGYEDDYILVIKFD